MNWHRGYSANEILFIDDREENFEPAARLGWMTHRFRSPEALTQTLTQLDPLK
jgi:FMN phosphatase YigB (HAD superfamily)